MFDCRDGDTGWAFGLSKMYSHTTGQISLARGNSTIFSVDVSNLVNYDDGQFHHVAFTCNNGIVKAYLDGTLAATYSQKYFLPTTPPNNTYTIGNDASNQGKMVIDQLEIFKGTLLEQSDIDTLVALRTTKDTEYETQYNARRDAQTTVTTDIISDSSLVANGTAVISGGEYVKSQTASGDATGTFSNDYITEELDHRFSFSTLFKFPVGEFPNHNGLHQIVLFDCRDGNTGWSLSLTKQHGSHTARVTLKRGTGGNLLEVNNNGNVSYTNIDGFTSLDNDQFNHIAITFDDGLLKAYLNGVTIRSFTQRYFLPIPPPNSTYAIGSSTTTRITLKGVKIYKGKSLTTQEITDIYDNRDN
jgi:hypothetical protein